MLGVVIFITDALVTVLDSMVVSVDKLGVLAVKVLGADVLGVVELIIVALVMVLDT